MNVLILMGSPRNPSNTAELCKPLMDELKAGGAQVTYVPLAQRDIAPCKGCYACQNVAGEYGFVYTPGCSIWGCTLCRMRTTSPRSNQKKRRTAREPLRERF